MPNEPGTRVERFEPTASPVVILLTWTLLALVSGAVVYIGVGMFCIAFDATAKAAQIGAGAAILVVWASFLWRYLLDDLWDDFFFNIERHTGTDLNQDGTIGAPEQWSVIRMATSNNSYMLDRLQVAPDLLRDWCYAALNGGSLSYTAWQDKFALPDGTRGQERYQEFRQYLASRGYIKEVGGNVGCRVDWQNPDAVRWVNAMAHTEPTDWTPLPSREDAEGLAHTADTH